MTAYLKLIRWKNLLFIILIQWLMQHSVVYPLLQTFGFETKQYNTLYMLLTAATVLIAAGRYVINDYFDVKIDRINKPEKVIAGEVVPLRSVMLLYQLLTGAGTLAGIILAILSKSATLGFIFILTPGLLWFYSASYKRQFVTGNLIVSLSSALSILVVGVLAVALLKTEYSSELLHQTPVPAKIYGWTGGFAGFAFILTWISKIINDIEDMDGDREMECRTMPVKWGISKTKYFLYALIIFTVAALFHAEYHFIDFEGTFTMKYLIAGLVIPLLVLAFLIFKSRKKEDFKQASVLSKIIMLTGMFYSLFFYYLQAKEYGISLFGLFLVK
ncbi:MAG: geranylgeranylglycerol-phosphate geranylgeranyltransferase [Paludibacteraceae bacterium]